MRMRVGAVLALVAGCYVLSLSGCAAPGGNITQTAAGTQLDQELDTSARNIDRVLDNIALAGGISGVTRQAGVVSVSGQLITVHWEGNASEVLRKIAQAKGLTFSESGRPLPCPVAIDATNTDFISVLKNIGTQLGGRADVVLKTGALEIRYRGA